MRDEFPGNYINKEDTELLFPSSVIPTLVGLRGVEWDRLISRILNDMYISEEKMAFTLFMVRLNNCVPCNSDSFRAMKGCINCSQQTIRRYKGSDLDLLDLYKTANKDLLKYLAKLSK